MKLHLFFFALVFYGLTLVSLARADEPLPPDAGPLNIEQFQPGLNALCGMGQQLEQGCARVQAREILEAGDWPWRTIGRVNSTDRNLSSHCTGTLISDRLVLTAAHCLYNLQRKDWIAPASLRFAAGYQRGKAQAVSSVARYVLPSVHDAQSRRYAGGFDQDWALLVLASPIRDPQGYLPVEAVPLTDDPGAKLLLPGYPAIRPHVMSLARDCGPPKPGHRGLWLQHCGAMQGDSGAPLLAQAGGKIWIAGLFVGLYVHQGQPHSVSISSAALIKALNALQSGGLGE